MNNECKRKQSFLLRLPLSVREQAETMAHVDGTSLNHFISLAVAEKISRMQSRPGKPPLPDAVGTSKTGLTYASRVFHTH